MRPTPLEEFVLDWKNGNEIVPGTENPTFDLPEDNGEGPGQMKRGLCVEGDDDAILVLYDSRGDVVGDYIYLGEFLQNLPEHAVDRFLARVVRALRDLLDEIDPVE